MYVCSSTQEAMCPVFSYFSTSDRSISFFMAYLLFYFPTSSFRFSLRPVSYLPPFLHMYLLPYFLAYLLFSANSLTAPLLFSLSSFPNTSYLLFSLLTSLFPNCLHYFLDFLSYLIFSSFPYLPLCFPLYFIISLCTSINPHHLSYLLLFPFPALFHYFLSLPPLFMTQEYFLLG